jgi:hypothetical protein
MITVGRSQRVVMAGALLFVLVPGRAHAAPQVQTVSPRGLQRGGTTTLTIDGSDLADARLLTALPVASQVVKKGATANRVEIEVTLDKKAPPGFYQLRLANVRGVSNALIVGVDDLPQLPFTPEITRLPVALHGALAGDATATTSFLGKKGQHVVVEVEARRLGSAIDPLLELHDPRGVQLAWSPGKSVLADDARLEAVLPADGHYAVLLRDALYRAGMPNQFRLKVGDLHYADRVFPLGVQRGTRATLQLLGRLPGDARVVVEANTALDEMPAPLPPVPAFTGKAPTLLVSDYPEIAEAAPPPGKLQEVAAPAAVSGHVAKPGEEDRYRFAVQPGMRLRVEVFANRVNSPLDGVLTVRNEAGAQLAAGDDQPDTVDPGLDFTVPAGVNTLVIAVTDLHGRGGPDFVYRLAVTPKDRADFRLTVFDDRLRVPQDGTAVVRVRAARQGYNGPIKLSLPDLQGVVLSGAEIPAGQTDTLLALTAPAGLPLLQRLTALVGESTGGRKIRRRALTPANAVTGDQPWLRGELALAVTAPEAVRVTWDTAETSFAVGATFAAKVKVARAAGAAGPVRLSLLTSQVVPRTKDGKQEDQGRAIRAAGAATVAAGQSAGAVSVVVPGDLPALPYDLAVRAELLSADGKTVLASAVTPGRRFQAVKPKPAAAKKP